MIINQIQQPRPFDLVGNNVFVAGVGSGFEAVLNYRVHDGHDERKGSFNVGGGTGEHGQFQIAVDVIGAAFALDRLFVEIFEESANDGSEVNKVVVPVIFGPRLVPNYIGFRLHQVKRGETLTAISRQHYGDAAHVDEIARANPAEIANPDLIIIGQILKIPIGS